MRFDLTPTVHEGDQRVVTKFLWLPVRIGNDKRWLEKATLRQTCHRMWDVTSGSEWMEWRSVEFLNK
jgi:hypothetical protein